MFLYKKKILFVLSVNFIFLLYLLSEYIVLLLMNDFYLKLIELELLIVFIFSLFSIYYLVKDWFDLYIIFLGMLLIFLFARPFIHLFGLLPMNNYNEGEWYRVKENFNFSNYTMIKINFILLFSLVFLNLGYLIGLLKYRKFSFFEKSLKKSLLYIKKSKYLNKKIGYMFFYIGLIAFVIKVILYVEILHMYGYFYLYSGNYTLPYVVRILDDFFYIGYYLIMVNFPSKREGYIVSFIFILFYSSLLLTGIRGEFFVMFLTVIWLLHFLYQWKIKLWQILLIFVILILIAQFAMAIKFSYAHIKFDLIYLIKNFLFSQGVTILILGYFIEFHENFVDIYSGFRYIISPFVSIFYALTGQYKSRQEMIPTEIYSVGEVLEYFTDPEGYYRGAGTGSSFIAELYGLGGDIFLIAIGCFLIGFFIAYLSKRLIFKRYGLFVSLFIIPIIFWIPRGGYVQPFQKFLFGWLFVICLICIFEFFKIKGKK